MKVIVSAIVLFLLLNAANAQVQSCSVESVVWQETFGTGNDNQLPLGKTSYSYSNSTLTQRNYRLSKNSQGGQQWHNSKDHTGNTNGLMLLANANGNSGEIYRDTVLGLQPGYFHMVSFYAMNTTVRNSCPGVPSNPRLQFIAEAYNADGTFTQLSSFYSNSLTQTANATWVKVSGNFTLPINVTAIRFRILNTTSGTCGLNLAIDDISFGICASAASLPAKGFQLNVQKRGSKTILEWATIQEFNTAQFSAERSEDGKNWVELAQVKAAGNSTQKRTYNFEDNGTFAGQVFYRISLKDIDGKISYSNIQVIREQQSGIQMTAIPNPFKSQTTLQITSDQEKMVTVKVIDMNGRLISQKEIKIFNGINQLPITVENMKRGIYHAELISADGSIKLNTKLVNL